MSRLLHLLIRVFSSASWLSFFISIAEERGLIVSIGSWVIEEAARQAAVWQNSKGLSIPIAVNVSAAQLRQKGFVEQLANSVRKHGIAPNRLELELTESIIMAMQKRRSK